MAWSSVLCQASWPNVCFWCGRSFRMARCIVWLLYHMDKENFGWFEKLILGVQLVFLLVQSDHDGHFCISQESRLGEGGHFPYQWLIDTWSVPTRPRLAGQSTLMGNAIRFYSGHHHQTALTFEISRWFAVRMSNNFKPSITGRKPDYPKVILLVSLAISRSENAKEHLNVTKAYSLDHWNDQRNHSWSIGELAYERAFDGWI